MGGFIKRVEELDAAQRAGARYADVSGSRIGFSLLKIIRQS
ncbi:hypothetical protein [Mesorhizobium sp. STM 4661]|nr:hypothetical protein [Mesorhizobium sp. STM 4661]